MKRLNLFCSMVVVVTMIIMSSCEKKDDGKITAAQVEKAYRDADYEVTSANAYNSTIENKNLEAIWYVSKDVGDDNVSGKIYVFSNSKTLNEYWEAWKATYPNNSHEFKSSSVQNALLTEICVNDVMSTTQLGNGGPGLNDDLVKGLINVLSSIKY